MTRLHKSVFKQLVSGKVTQSNQSANIFNRKSISHKLHVSLVLKNTSKSLRVKIWKTKAGQGKHTNTSLQEIKHRLRQVATWRNACLIKLDSLMLQITWQRLQYSHNQLQAVRWWTTDGSEAYKKIVWSRKAAKRRKLGLLSKNNCLHLSKCCCWLLLLFVSIHLPISCYLQVLTLASNERIPLTPTMRMLFEISHLKAATPATVSRWRQVCHCFSKCWKISKTSQAELAKPSWSIVLIPDLATDGHTNVFVF